MIYINEYHASITYQNHSTLCDYKNFCLLSTTQKSAIVIIIIVVYFESFILKAMASSMVNLKLQADKNQLSFLFSGHLFWLSQSKKPRQFFAWHVISDIMSSPTRDCDAFANHFSNYQEGAILRPLSIANHLSKYIRTNEKTMVRLLQYVLQHYQIAGVTRRAPKCILSQNYKFL